MSVVAIIIGASSYKGYYVDSDAAPISSGKQDLASAIGASHELLLKYIQDSRGLKLKIGETLLDLFDSELDNTQTISQITSWLEPMAKDQSLQLIVYFVGHGQPVDNDYYLILHGTDATTGLSIRNTGIESKLLVSTLVSVAPMAHQHIIIDACNSGFVTTQELAWNYKMEDGADVTISILASASPLSSSVADRGTTAFTGLFVDELTTRRANLELESLVDLYVAIVAATDKRNQDLGAGTLPKPLIRVHTSPGRDLSPPAIFPTLRATESVQQFKNKATVAAQLKRILAEYDRVDIASPEDFLSRLTKTCGIAQVIASQEHPDIDKESLGLNCNIMIPYAVTDSWPKSDLEMGSRKVYYPEEHLKPEMYGLKYGFALCLVAWADQMSACAPKGLALLVDKTPGEAVFGAPLCFSTFQEQHVTDIKNAKNVKKYSHGQSAAVAQSISEYLFEREFRSFYCFPIRHNGACTGVLTIQSKEGRVFRGGVHSEPTKVYIRDICLHVGQWLDQIGSMRQTLLTAIDC